MVYNRLHCGFLYRLRGDNVDTLIAEAIQHQLKILNRCGNEFPRIKRHAEHSIRALKNMEVVTFKNVKNWDRVIMRTNNG